MEYGHGDHVDITVEPTPARRRPAPAKSHRTRYYAHRVKESLTSRISKFVCAIFLFLLLILGIIAFILWLSLRPHRPRFHIQSFSFPALAQDAFPEPTVSFNVSDRNPNQNVGIYYDALGASLYYREKVVGAVPLPGTPFYQPPKNTTWMVGVMAGAGMTVTEEVWRQMVAERVAGGRVMFRLEIVSAVHFKVSTWGSKRHRMHSSCDVEVGIDGQASAQSKEKRCSIYFD